MTHTIENSNNELLNLMQKVKDQAERSKDFIAPTNALQIQTLNKDGSPADDSEQSKFSRIVVEREDGEPTYMYNANDVALSQIGQRAGIDSRTMQRLQQGYPTQFDSVINAIWQKEPKNTMIRTFMDSDTHGIARAVLSDKFKTFDNTNLLNSAIPQLMESEAQWKVVNADVTDKRLYLRLKSEVITGEGANKGDLMASGIGLSNSEVGAGSVQVYQMYWTLACLNGMQTENRHRQSHITSSQADGETWKMLTNEAKDADNKALELKVRDLVAGYTSRDSFDEVVDKMKTAGQDIIEGSVNNAVDNLGKVINLTKKETSSVLDGLMATIGQEGYAGNAISRATMVNAVTNVANRVDADEMDDWQRRGGQILNMNKTDWNRVAVAV
tara:strand:- start:1181 stop:2335 length:1155 start_codon:yes stop_codon:yes gene_type:complete